MSVMTCLNECVRIFETDPSSGAL